jgi:3-oxoadipate enol-lactonase
MTARTVAVPGGRLWVTDEGSGPPILLFHAGIVESAAWAPLTSLLRAAGYRTVAFDRRGIGASTTDDVDFSNRADARAIMDALDLDQVCLVGESIGAQIAVDVAVETPGRVTALVLVSGSVGGFEPEPTPEEADLFARMDALEEDGTADEIADFDVRLWVDGRGQPETRVPAAIREEVRAMDRRIGDPTRVRGRSMPLKPRAVERLDALTMPVLAIAGGLDVSDVTATAQHLARVLPRATARVWPDVAHLISLEAPDRLARAIVEHLQAVPSWR